MDGSNYLTSNAELLVAPIFTTDPSPTTFEYFIKCCATHQYISNTALVAHIANSFGCLSQSASLGP